MALLCVNLMFSLVFLAILALGQSNPVGHDRCQRVRQAHQIYLSRQSAHHHSRGIKDLCPQRASSCCLGLELAIEIKTRDHFVGQLRSHLDTFRLSFEQRESRIRAQLASIFNETIDRVNKRYPVRIAHANQELIKSVSRSVFRAHQQGSLDRHVDNLLRAIVVSEFESHSPSISADYLNCLSSVNFVDFFGAIRSKLARSMLTAIETSRLILQSFQLSSKLLARSEQVRLDEKCVRQLAGSLHCGTCLQSSLDPGTRPCRSTCRSVVSSCMASSELVHISQAWKELTQSLGKLVDSVVAQRNPETIFAAYPNLLNGALELARSKNEIFKKARVSCGPLELSRMNSVAENDTPYSTEHKYAAYSESLFVSIESMAHLWNHNKDIFDRLHHKVCDQYSETDCQETHNGLNIPKAEPLVNLTASSDEIFDSLRHYHSAVNTIQSSRLRLSNSTVYAFDDESSHSDSFLHDGSGSGYSPDDEDLDGEGSGEKLGPDTTTQKSSSMRPDDFDFTESPEPNPEGGPYEGQGNDTGSGSSALLHPNCLLFLVTLAVASLLR